MNKQLIILLGLFVKIEKNSILFTRTNFEPFRFSINQVILGRKGTITR